MNQFILNLQIFGEGGDGGASAASAGTAETGTAGSGVTAPAAGAQQAQPTKTPEEEFEELIAGDKYKSIFQKRVNGIVGERVKAKDRAIKDANSKLDRANELLRTVGSRAYGMTFGDNGAVDYDAFQTHVDNDREMISKAAAAAGLSDDAFLERERYKRETESLKAERDAAFNQRFYERAMRQAEEAKALYPTLDLNREMENPAFATMIRNGFSVQDSYEAVHHKEIVTANREEAARLAAERLSSTIQANGARPAENGLRRQAPAIGGLDPDPRKWTKEQRAQIRRNAAAGHPDRF